MRSRFEEASHLPFSDAPEIKDLKTKRETTS